MKQIFSKVLVLVSLACLFSCSAPDKNKEPEAESPETAAPEVNIVGPETWPEITLEFIPPNKLSGVTYVMLDEERTHLSEQVSRFRNLAINSTQFEVICVDIHELLEDFPIIPTSAVEVDRDTRVDYCLVYLDAGTVRQVEVFNARKLQEQFRIFYNPVGSPALVCCETFGTETSTTVSTYEYNPGGYLSRRCQYNSDDSAPTFVYRYFARQQYKVVRRGTFDASGKLERSIQITDKGPQNWSSKSASPIGQLTKVSFYTRMMTGLMYPEKPVFPIPKRGKKGKSGK